MEPPEPESGGESETEGGGEFEPAWENASAAIYYAVGEPESNGVFEAEGMVKPEGAGEPEPQSHGTELGVSSSEFVAMFTRFQRVRRNDDNELACDEIWDHYECFSSCQAWYDRLCHVKQAKTVYDQIAALVFTGHRDESTVAPEGKGKGSPRQGRGASR